MLAHAKKTLFHFCLFGFCTVSSFGFSYELFYLSVGNGNYNDSSLDIPDGNLSARQVAQLLQTNGAVDGITLLSEDEALVTTDDVFDALREIAGRASEADDPLVVYYFIGHGQTVEPGGVHVSLTGEYVPAPATAEARPGVVETAEVQSVLEEEAIPYILVLDNCFFREPLEGFAGFGRTVSDKLIESGNVLEGLTFGKKESDPKIALFAAAPGSVTQTLPHPSSDRYSIGPLARRLILLAGSTPDEAARFSIGNFVEQMNDPSFDPKSVVGHQDVTITNPEKTFLPGSGGNSAGETRNGTGSGG